MTCPHCESAVTTERSDRTELGIIVSAVVTAAVSLMDARGHHSIVSNFRRMSSAWWSCGVSATN
jgi:hypothetical protein